MSVHSSGMLHAPRPAYRNVGRVQVQGRIQEIGAGQQPACGVPRGRRNAVDKTQLRVTKPKAHKTVSTQNVNRASPLNSVVPCQQA